MTTEICVAEPLALEVVWADGEVTALHLTWAADRQQALTTEAGKALQAALTRYVAGEAPDWPALPLRFDGLTPFARRVLTELARVPYGQLVSYGWLATQAGNPKAARAVGRVMASNPFPMLIPCQRVVGANGALVGFGPGVEMKKYLLEREGALTAS
ncbi:MAG: methylated-DNA--[protein]-cysteine S-methyltransferase [Solidesulfovibrio sp.]